MQGNKIEMKDSNVISNKKSNTKLSIRKNSLLIPDSTKKKFHISASLSSCYIGHSFDSISILDQNSWREFIRCIFLHIFNCILFCCICYAWHKYTRSTYYFTEEKRYNRVKKDFLEPLLCPFYHLINRSSCIYFLCYSYL